MNTYTRCYKKDFESEEKMMKKILCAVMTLVMLAAMLTACGSTSGNEKPGNEPSGTETVTYDPIKITEDYTFEDPTDIEFDKRYVLACDENSPMVSSAADYGMTAAYTIIYAKEDAPVASYDFLVVDTEEHAKALVDLYATQGSTLTAVDGNPTVLTSSMDGDTMEGTLVAFQSYGMISEATVSAYVEFYSQSIGAKVQ